MQDFIALTQSGQIKRICLEQLVNDLLGVSLCNPQPALGRFPGLTAQRSTHLDDFLVPLQPIDVRLQMNGPHLGMVGFISQ